MQINITGHQLDLPSEPETVGARRARVQPARNPLRRPKRVHDVRTDGRLVDDDSAQSDRRHRRRFRRQSDRPLHGERGNSRRGRVRRVVACPLPVHRLEWRPCCSRVVVQVCCAWCLPVARESDSCRSLRNERNRQCRSAGATA